jgi:hypothetical protein
MGRLVRLFDRSVPAEYDYWAVWNGTSRKRSLIGDFVDAVASLFTGGEKASSTD